MANEFVQTMSDARVDARSLSDFVFKPAGFKVARRLAPPVDTLQFYINRFNSLDGDFSSSVSVALSSLNDSVAEADDKVAHIETTVQDAIDQSILSSGFVTIDSFELGATITERNQALRHAETGKLYRWAGDLPKLVATSSTPTSTGGINEYAWLEVSDTVLRQELASSSGATKIGGVMPTVSNYAALISIPELRVDGLEVNLTDPMRGGVFTFNSDDLTTKVLSDPLQGIYVAAVGNGSQGSFVRKVGQHEHFKISWFGATGIADFTATQAFTEIFKHANINNSVRVDLVGGTHTINVSSESLVKLTDLNLVSILTGDSVINDDTNYPLNTHRKIFHLLNCKNIKTDKWLNFVGKNTDRVLGNIIGAEAFHLESCENIDVKINSTGGKSGLSTAVALPVCKDLKAKTISTNDHYGVQCNNIETIDVISTAVNCMRSGFYMGVKKGRASLYSKGQRIATLLKHYDGTPNSENFDLKAVFDDCNPETATYPAFVVETQCLPTSVAHFKDINIDLSVSNSLATPRTRALFAVSSVKPTGEPAYDIDHVFENFTVTGALKSNGSGASCIVYPFLGTFPTANNSIKFRDIVADTLPEFAVGAGIDIADCDFANSRYQQHWKVGGKLRNVIYNDGSNATKINIFKVMSYARVMFKLTYRIIRDTSTPTTGYTGGVISGYWNATSSGVISPLVIDSETQYSSFTVPSAMTLSLASGTGVSYLAADIASHSGVNMVATYDIEFTFLPSPLSGLVSIA